MFPRREMFHPSDSVFQVFPGHWLALQPACFHIQDLEIVHVDHHFHGSGKSLSSLEISFPDTNTAFGSGMLEDGFDFLAAKIGKNGNCCGP